MRFLLILICASPIWASAQDNFAELQKIINAYKTEQAMFYTVQYHYFQDLNSKQATDSMTMKISHQGKNYLMQSEQLDMMHYQGKSVWVNHLDKQITVSQNTGEESSQIGLDLEMLKQVGNQQGLKLRSFPVSGKQAGLRFEAPGISDTKMEFIYDKETYLLQSCLIYISIDESEAALFTSMNNVRMEITYRDYKQGNNKFSSTTSRYYKQSGGQLYAAAAFEDYKLIEIK